MTRVSGFKGVCIDCNAVSPATALQVADIVIQQGGTCVDGGIIGPPSVLQELPACTCLENPLRRWLNCEMQEIANTLEDAGLPRGWFDAAAETYQWLSGFKNESGIDQQDVIDALVNKGNSS